MSRCCRVYDGGFGIPKVRGQGENLRGINTTPRGRLTAAHLKGQHATKRRLLAGSECVSRVFRQARIVRPLDLRLLL